MAKPRRSEAKRAHALKGPLTLVVAARFYEDISDALLEGATRALAEAGAEWDVVSVPGSLEIPPAIAIALDSRHARAKPYDGVGALGCVIRGGTSHYDIVAHQAAPAPPPPPCARPLERDPAAASGEAVLGART